MLWLVLFLSALTPADAQCDVGWKYFPGTHSCFQMFSRTGDFYSSDLFCHLQEARLASLTTKEETDFVENLVKEGYPRTAADMPFLGLTAPSTDCNHLWLDGSPLNTSAVRWHPGQPSDCRTAAFCVSLKVPNSNYDQNMILDDVRCENKLKRILCKRPALTSASVEVKMPCEDGWTYYEETNSCFKNFVRPTKIDTALSHCKSFESHLVYIETPGETNFLREMIVKGPIKSPLDFSFVDLNVNDQDCAFRWADSSPINTSVVGFNRNSIQKPNFCRAGQACVVFQPSWSWPDWYKSHYIGPVSSWFKGGPLAIIDDMWCTNGYNRVMCKKGAVKPLGDFGVCERGWTKVKGTNACQKDRHEPPKIHKNGDPPCEDGWSFFEGTRSCFKSFYQSGNFLAADSFCHGQKARLASLTTREETEFVTKLVGGAYSTSGSDTSYVGLTGVNRDCIFTWLDGSPLNTSAVSWAPENPDWCRRQYVCVQLNPNAYSNIMLNDVNCEKVLKRTLCQKPAQPDCLPSKGKEGECEEGWTFYGGTKSCYKNFARPAKYESSKSHCRSFGAEMHFISSKDETVFLSNLLKQGPVPTWRHMPLTDLTAFQQDCYFKGPDLRPIDISTYFQFGRISTCNDRRWCARWQETKWWSGLRFLIKAFCNDMMYRVLCKKNPIGSTPKEIDCKNRLDEVKCKDGWVRLEKTNTCVKNSSERTPRRIEENMKEKCQSMPFASYFQLSTGICFVQSNHCASVPYPEREIKNSNFESVTKMLKIRGMSTDPSQLCAFGQTPLCRAGEIYKDGHCLWITKKTGSWSAVSNECQKGDGTLFVPHNDGDMQNVLAFLSSEKPSPTAVWLGLVSTEKWTSLDGTTVDYFRWTAKQTESPVSSIAASLFLVEAVSEKNGAHFAYMQAAPVNGSYRGICSRASIQV